MANQYIRMMEKREVFIGEAGSPIDLGAYKSVVAQIRVLSAGSGGTLCLQHAAKAEGSAFKNLGDPANLNGTTNDVQAHTDFLRWVRFLADDNVAGNPIACIDIVAKEY